MYTCITTRLMAALLGRKLFKKCVSTRVGWSGYWVQGWTCHVRNSLYPLCYLCLLTQTGQVGRNLPVLPFAWSSCISVQPPTWSSPLPDLAPYLVQPPTWSSPLRGPAPYLVQPPTWSSPLPGLAPYLVQPPT